MGRTLLFRIIYGFRIELYDLQEKPVLSLEAADGKHTVRVDGSHYREIAPQVSTSIPQIRRDFTERFSNGQRYLEAAARKFSQPTHHARKIMLLQDLYDDPVLDRFIGYCIDQDKMDIRSFKGILRDYNAGKLELPDTEAEKPGCAGKSSETGYRDDDPALIR